LSDNYPDEEYWFDKKIHDEEDEEYGKTAEEEFIEAFD
jgi:hypothetical protein